MFNSLLNLLFRCPHQRMTRPMTPARKAGVASADTYVVCLECGRQFLYDMKEMRIGKPVAVTPLVGVLHERMTASKTKKLRYMALASAVPIALIIGVGWLKKNGERRKGHKSKGTSELDENGRPEL